jgi:hypothetical protein
MTLAFPNRSRSYDPEHRRIRFWGHDASVEVTFLIDQDALLKLAPATGSAEAAILSAFDKVRERILEAAARIYAPKQRRSFYVLSAADF